MFGSLISIPDNYFEDKCPGLSNDSDSMHLKKFSNAEIFIINTHVQQQRQKLNNEEPVSRIGIIYDSMNIDEKTLTKLNLMVNKLRDAYPEHELLDSSYDFVIHKEDDGCHLIIVSLIHALTLDEFMNFYNSCRVKHIHQQS